jgi:N-carbamoylputrescine amidase
MKIALVQQHATQDVEDNLKRGLAAFKEAALAGANLVAYAELGLSWFLPQHPATKEMLKLAETIPGRTTEAFAGKAKELGAVAVVNLFERDGRSTYDTTAVIDANGEIVGKNRMVHIAELPCFHEKGYYAPGDLGAGVFDTVAGRIGIAICYDRHFPEYMRSLALKGADLVIVPQAGAVDEWPDGMYEAELRIAAFHNGYFTALVNRVGKEDCITFAGESFVTDPAGTVIAHAPKLEDHILYADIDFTQLEKCPARKFFLRDRRPDIYRDL